MKHSRVQFPGMPAQQATQRTRLAGGGSSIRIERESGFSLLEGRASVSSTVYATPAPWARDPP